MARKTRIKKQLRQLSRELRGKQPGTQLSMGQELLASGVPLAFLSYVQIPPNNRRGILPEMTGATGAPSRRDLRSWPKDLAKEINESIAHTNISEIWMDKMGYPDITTLGVASGLRPYASDNGLVVVRGAYGKEYHGYHFVSSCGSFQELLVQNVMEKQEHLEALRWTATSRLWPSAEVAIGVMHGRILPTTGTVRACYKLLQILDRAIRQLQMNTSIESDLGFSCWKCAVKCKACGKKNTVEDVYWESPIVGVRAARDRINRWIDMLEHWNGGMAENFLVHYVVGPMWDAECFNENDRLPVATLTSYLWLHSGDGGTELSRNLNKLVNRRDDEALIERLASALGGTLPKFWYESFEKEIERISKQISLAQEAKHGTQGLEWRSAVWFYPSPGRGFFGDLTFSKGKKLVLEALERNADAAWEGVILERVVEQQRSMWPVVGTSLPWFFTVQDEKTVVLVPVILSRGDMHGQSMSRQVGPIQYVLETELTNGGEVVMQIPIGGNLKSVVESRESSGLMYLAFSLEQNALKFVALRPCHDTKNMSWCNIHPNCVAHPPVNRHTPPQDTMFGANGSPRDYTNMYEVWIGRSGFGHLGTLDERNVYDGSLTTRGTGQVQSSSIGWNWKPVADQERVAEQMDERVIFILKAWVEPWL